MRKEEIGLSVEMLLNYLGENTIDGRVNFLSFLEGCCDSESLTYILWDLHTLANTIEAHNAYFLVNEIAKYDYKSAQQLKMLLTTA